MSYAIAQSVAVDDKQIPREPGAINGGLFPRPKEAPHPTLYVDVNSIDEALKKVKAGGGKVGQGHPAGDTRRPCLTRPPSTGARATADGVARGRRYRATPASRPVRGSTPNG